MIKCIHNMSREEKKAVVKEFLELHQSSNEECMFDCKIDERNIMFYPKRGNTLHSIEDIVKFAEYYNSHVFCGYYNNKVTAVIC